MRTTCVLVLTVSMGIPAVSDAQNRADDNALNETPGLVIEEYTISRDDQHHEGWPTVCFAANGDLVCSYSVADVHGGGAVPRAMVRISKDQGRTWSEPIVFGTQRHKRAPA